jgi:AcrR family transcriptional regulator
MVCKTGADAILASAPLFAGLFRPANCPVPPYCARNVSGVKQAERRASAIESVLEGALATMVSGGYAQLRVADVARASGMSEGTLFRYFPTKNDLVKGVLEKSLADHLQRLVDAFVALPPEAVTRRTLLELLFSVLSHEQFVWTYELYVASTHDADLATKVSAVLKTHAGNVDSMTESLLVNMGLVPSADVRMVVNLATWSMQGLVINDLARGGESRKNELIDYLVKVSELAYGFQRPESQ